MLFYDNYAFSDLLIKNDPSKFMLLLEYIGKKNKR